MDIFDLYIWFLGIPVVVRVILGILYLVIGVILFYVAFSAVPLVVELEHGVFVYSNKKFATVSDLKVTFPDGSYVDMTGGELKTHKAKRSRGCIIVKRGEATIKL